MKRWLAVLMLTLGFSLGGCATLDAWRSEFGYNHKTGQIDADTKGAGEGGRYNENTGLNVTSGDNTPAAIAVVGALALCILMAYPLQRSMRLWAEGKSLDNDKKRKTKRKRKKS